MDVWERSVRRADHLAAAGGPTSELLAFYGRLLRCQTAIYSGLMSATPSGSMAQDLARVGQPRSALLRTVADHGPAALAAEALTLLESGAAATDMLLLHWQSPSDGGFFAKAILQPYGYWLAESGGASEAASSSENRCPRCGGAAQLSILDAPAGPAGDGGGRRLQCSACLSTWPFRRVLCPSCGEEDEHQLGYFQSPAFDHVRIDVCRSCRRYLKSIDLGRLGLAVPLVDEVASAPLDLWVREQGYEKIELNLVGL